MEIFLVTSSDYDYALIDSAWATREEAEARIAEAQAVGSNTGDRATDEKNLYSYNFRVTVVKLGEVRGLSKRFNL